MKIENALFAAKFILAAEHGKGERFVPENFQNRLVVFGAFVEIIGKTPSNFRAHAAVAAGEKGDIAHAVLVFAVQRYALPHAVPGQIGRPIPTEMALCLAHENPLFVENGYVAVVFKLFHLFQGGAQQNSDFVFALAQRRFDGKFVLHEHIVGLAHRHAVDENFRKGIYPVAL